MNFPFRQQAFGNNNLLREFSKDVEPTALVWHRDRLDRVVTVYKGKGWQLQMENQLPVRLQQGKSYSIPKNTYHRILKGSTNLVVEIQEIESDSQVLREWVREILKEEPEALDIGSEFEDEESESSDRETEALEIETVGDLKDAIAAATGKKREKKGKKAAKNFAKSVFIDLFPGMGTITGAAEALAAMYNMPDDKRTGTALDYLDVDDDVSAIVDDPIENAFLKELLKIIESYDDDKPLKDFQMTSLLSKYIQSKFNKRTVSGFEE